MGLSPFQMKAKIGKWEKQPLKNQIFVFANYSALKNSTFILPNPVMAIFQGGVIRMVECSNFFHGDGVIEIPRRPICHHRHHRNRHRPLLVANQFF